ncbi:hypothetical protein BH09PSE4_BH09PSE4_12110 [soil metagenome]
MFVTMIAMLAMTADVHRVRPVRHATAAQARARTLRYQRARAANMRAARMVARASNRINVTDCKASTTCLKGDARYRLDVAEDMPATAKENAVNDTGKECSITGSVVCVHPPTQIVKTAM